MKALLVIGTVLMLTVSCQASGYVELDHKSAASADTNTATTAAQNVPTANLVTVIVVDSVAVTASVISDSQGNSYSQCGSTYPTSAEERIRLMYKQGASIASASFTVTATSTSGYPALLVHTWTGSTASPCDQSSGNNSDATITLLPTAAITPTLPNELVLTGCGVNVIRALSFNGGFTEQDEVTYNLGTNFGGSAAYLIQTSAASAQPTCDNNGSNAAMAVVIGSFKAANPTAALRRRRQ